MHKIVILLCLAVNFLRPAVAINCAFKSGTNKLTRPRITKIFGETKEKNIPYDVEETILFEGESVRIYCATGTIDSSMPERGRLHNCNGGNYNFLNTSDIIICNDLKFATKESQLPFDWCNLEENVASYVITVGNINDTYLAEICFNFDNMTPTVMYFSASKYYYDHNDLSMISTLFGKNKKSLRNGTIFQGQKISTAVETTRSSSKWAEFEQFEYNSLIQNTIIKDIQGFGSLADIIWWRNLKNWNWALYMKALDKQSEKSIFKIFAGSSGVVTGPQIGENYSNQFEEIHVLPYNKTIPTYIWNIVQEVNGTELFVVVGYNSPYFDLFEPNDQIVFCNDICSNIQWLKDESTCFKSAIFGRIFCCYYDEVQHSSILNNFPENLSATETVVENNNSTYIKLSL